MFVLPIALSQRGHLSFDDCVMFDNVCIRGEEVCMWSVSGVSLFLKAVFGQVHIWKAV